MAIDHARRLWENLELLGLFPEEHAVDTFMSKSDAKLVDKMIHFLFTKMSPKESLTRFRGCWPVLDHIGNKDFRLAAFKWTIDLKEAGLLPPDLPLRRSFLDDGHGDKFVMIMMWVSVWALRKQAALENYAQIKYPAAIYEPYACTTPEAKDELHEKYLPTQKEVLKKVLKTFQAKRTKFEAIIDALQNRVEAQTQDGSVEDAASKMLQELKETASKLAELDRRDELKQKLGEAEAALDAAQSENERLRSELRLHTTSIFGPDIPPARPVQVPITDAVKKEQLIAALLSADILEEAGSPNQNPTHNPSILGSDLDADFLVR